METHEYIARSPRPKLVMEMMVAKLMSIRSVVPIDALFTTCSFFERSSSTTKSDNISTKKKTILNDGVSQLGKSPEKKQTTNQELQTRNNATDLNPKTISQISPSQSIDSKVNDEDQRKENTKEKLHTENHNDQSSTTPTQKHESIEGIFDSNTLSNPPKKTYDKNQTDHSPKECATC